MFQKVVIFLFFLCSFCVNAQKKYHKSYYSNGQIKEEGWIQNSDKNGYWKFYYKNGNLKKEGHFLNNLELLLSFAVHDTVHIELGCSFEGLR